jgi:hypothetical protein
MSQFLALDEVDLSGLVVKYDQSPTSYAFEYLVTNNNLVVCHIPDRLLLSDLGDDRNTCSDCADATAIENRSSVSLKRRLASVKLGLTELPPFWIVSHSCWTSKQWNSCSSYQVPRCSSGE